MTANKLIKVCGMREAENIRAVEQLGVDMIGFIFYPKSARYLYELPDYLPVNALRVGVFVNEDKQTIEAYAHRFGLDYIQLHGNESPEDCQSLRTAGMKIIKAFSIAHDKDLQQVHKYEDMCDYLLFDTKTEQFGGSGKQFDWNVLHAYNGHTPFLLSGGINLYSTKALKSFYHPSLAGFDINSQFELSPGKKDTERINQFLQKLKQ